MKKSSFVLSCAAISLSAGALLYTYSKMHPIKTQMAMNKARDMMDKMKDFK